MKSKVCFLCIVAILVGLTAATVSAGVLSTTGITVISPPASVTRNTTESDTTIFLFFEQQSLVLSSDLAVDIIDPGTYGETPGGTIPAGTCINSYFIHYDLVTGNIYRSGSVTFEEDVIGLINWNETLDASDYLGAPGTFYANSVTDGEIGRRSELTGPGNTDRLTLSADRRTVSVRMFVNAFWQDQVRVITQGSCEPEPPPPAGCDLITTGMTVIAPPASVARGMTESNETIFAFCEQRGVTLDSDLQIDISSPGTYGTADGGVIAAGTCVNSYFIHYDLVDIRGFRSGSAIFGEEVLGLILTNVTLDAYNWLGAPETFYPKMADGEIGRRSELGSKSNSDWVTLSTDRRTLDARLWVDSRWQDQIRVITLGVYEPDPYEVIEVVIDAKPNSDPSYFNSKGVGVIPVAILGSKDFNVKEIDVETLELDGAPVATKPDSDKLMFAYEDHNHDGFKDLVVKFVDTDNYDPGDEWATLTGFLKDGTQIHGVGDICITQ